MVVYKFLSHHDSYTARRRGDHGARDCDNNINTNTNTSTSSNTNTSTSTSTNTGTSIKLILILVLVLVLILTLVLVLVLILTLVLLLILRDHEEPPQGDPHTCHILPPSEIDLGLCLAVLAGSEGRYLFRSLFLQAQNWPKGQNMATATSNNSY